MKRHIHKKYCCPLFFLNTSIIVSHVLFFGYAYPYRITFCIIFVYTNKISQLEIIFSYIFLLYICIKYLLICMLMTNIEKLDSSPLVESLFLITFFNP